MDQTGRVGRHRKTSLRAEAYFARVSPFTDEILSSCLVRNAHRYGMSPHRFVTHCFPGEAVWTRDIDASSNASLFGKVGELLSIDATVVRSMTLLSLFEATSLEQMEWRYGRSWTNSIGVFHRMRNNFGLQYCPMCLQSEPFFRRHWRLVCAFACPRHELLLQDCCQFCGVPIILHRCKLDITRCWKCGSSLCAVKIGLMPIAADVLTLQARLIAWIDESTTCAGSSIVPRALFVRGATIVLRILKEYMHRHNGQWLCDASTSEMNTQLRLLRVPARVRLLSILMELMDEWPANFLQFALAAKVTQIAVGHCGAVPQWMNVVIKQLPVRSYFRGNGKRSEFVRYVRHLEKNGGTACRSIRAQALMLAAKGNYEH